jgi:hypothetical protein
MAVENQRAGRFALGLAMEAGPATDNVEAVSEGNAIIAKRWVVLEILEFGGDDFGGEAQALKFVGDEVLSFLLEAGESWELNQFLKEENQVIAEAFDLGGDRAD